MNRAEIIKTLITDRTNELLVKHIQVNLNPGSLGNPKISVGTTPFYEWNKGKDAQIGFVLTYGRFLNCELLVYNKQIKNDASFIFAKGAKEATKKLNEILDKIEAQFNKKIV